MPTVNDLITFLNTNNHIGSQNAITARNLALHFNVSDGGVEVEIRDIIREAINQGNLIGSHNRGFYLISCIDEVEHNLNSLRSRAENIIDRRRNILNTWNTNNPQDTTDISDIDINEI